MPTLIAWYTPKFLPGYLYSYLQGGPQKCLYFSLAITFTKIRKNLQDFFSTATEVYRIVLVETTLESMFYYTFSVINTMFVLCTALLYDSPAGTRTLNLSTTLLSISCGIRLISLLMLSSRNETVPWEVMPEVFKCSVREMSWHLISRRQENT